MMHTPEKVANSMAQAKEQAENEVRSLAALREAQRLEHKFRKAGRLVKIKTMNGIIETTCPEKYEEYHKLLKIK